MKRSIKLPILFVAAFIVVTGLSITINKSISDIRKSNEKENSGVIEDNQSPDSVVVFGQNEESQEKETTGEEQQEDGKEEQENKDNTEEADGKTQDGNGDVSSENPQESEGENGNIHIGVGPNGEADTFDAKTVWSKLRGDEYEKPQQKIAFLTFDDGPSAEVTPQILDVLERNNVKATFFVVGSSLSSETSKEILKRIYNDGNAIGNHTYSHKYDKLYPGGVLDLDALLSEIHATDKAISDALGVDFKTSVVRCPGGSFSWNGMDKMREYFLNNGMAAVDWNALNGDAETSTPRTPDELLARANETMHGSDLQVILMHDARDKQNTAAMLQSLIDELKARGYIFKTLV